MPAQAVQFPVALHVHCPSVAIIFSVTETTQVKTELTTLTPLIILHTSREEFILSGCLAELVAFLSTK